jgi:hypothetical protein
MTKTVKTLGAAACALLGAPSIAPAADANWEIDTATLYYAEQDRVSLFEPVLSARRNWDQHSFGAKLTVDTLTGPSPSGATPASTPQTTTGPSGGATYSTKPGEIPLDDSFEDTRFALALDYTAPLPAEWSGTAAVNFSTEYDYQSIGGSLRLQRDFNQHNTTFAFGASVSSDTIDPVGGTPEGLSLKQNGGNPGDDDEDESDDDRDARGSSENKTVVDLLAGVTQVIDPHSLVRLNLVYSDSSGYQTDPYKILSVVGSDGEPLRYVYEKRPDSRTKTGAFVEYVRDFSGDVFKTSYRYLTDDWGIDSHTLETSYRFKLGAADYLEPQLRYYMQTSADFYHVALYDGEENAVDYASADYRLGKLDAWTAGLQYGHRFASGSDLMLRASYYVQTPAEDEVPAQAAEGLSKFDQLVPDTKAIMLTVGYRFDL